MTITKKKEDTTLTIALEGRLDTTTTAHELEAALNESLDGIESLIIELKELAYLSSAGLRVLLSAQKRMDKQGKMVVRNVNEIVRDVFEVTGLTDILTIE